MKDVSTFINQLPSEEHLLLNAEMWRDDIAESRKQEQPELAF